MTTNPHSSESVPDVSFIMPCYNEEAIIGYTMPRLMNAFAQAGHVLELVAVDNGSSDRTGEKIRELQTQFPGIVLHRVEVNEGYGKGVLEAIPLCRAAWVGIIPADGQVDEEDVVRLYEAVQASEANILGKVRRRFRMDPIRRKIVSVAYNMMVRALWPSLASLDINGSPKILPRDAIQAMDLKSYDWLLDPEIMIKAHYMGMQVLELNVFGRMRGNGVSHVRIGTVGSFIRYLLMFKFSPSWRRRFKEASKAVDSLNLNKKGA